MKRLVYLLPAVCMGLALTACPGGDDGTAVTATEGDTENDEDSNTTTGPSTVTTPTVSETTPTTTGETDPPTTTDQPTTTGPETEATTEPPMCTEADECIMDEDCPIPGASCVACFCTGGEGCPMYGPGEFGDCLEGGTAACMGSTGAACVVDNVMNPTAGVCYSTCEETCDCPAPPAGFEAQLTCGQLVDDAGNCYIDCSGDGDECPDGWQCVQNYFCAIGEAVELPGYGDCVNEGGTCPETDGGSAGGCLGVPAPAGGESGAGGVCTAGPCDDAMDCPDAPATGDAVVTCADVTMDGMDDCFLDCTDATCPDGMICHADFDVCFWETNLLEPYGACLDAKGTCPDGPNGGLQNCLQDNDGTLSWCTNECTDVDDCPAEPTGTGDAPVACVTIGTLGDFCVLDCADGQTCPDGMTCELDFCVNPVP